MTKGTFTIKMGCIGVATLMCFLAAPAVRAHMDPDTEMQKMDTNGDGKISVEEHAAGAKTMFEKMDTNGDGKVTAAEMEAKHGTHDKAMKESKAERMEMSATEKIKAIDKNNDGVLTAEEHADGAKTMFEKMDTNKDGYLTKAELKAGHAKLMSKGAK